ncbi:unnamed protein product [Lasius platythorax]|uniref:30s ribosomal protein s3 n=2 Tax=Lasius TaxID=488720 RepID=A0A0J7KWQ7_LASNI|nr:30s ribosomal protein s3 [Lasius niger]
MRLNPRDPGSGNLVGDDLREEPHPRIAGLFVGIDIARDRFVRRLATAGASVRPLRKTGELAAVLPGKIFGVVRTDAFYPVTFATHYVALDSPWKKKSA